MGRLFGTNGVRGIVGSTMTPELTQRLGRAVATAMPGLVLVATDTRTSGPVLKAAFVAGLRSCGADVVDCGVAPTPALQYGVKTGRYAAGAIITASHNPPEFNGIKVVEPDGTEASAKTESRIEDAYFSEKFTNADFAGIGAESEDPTVVPRYVDGIVSLVDVEAIRRAKLKILLDCANGAGTATGPQTLARLGVRVISLNAQPDGRFPGHPSEPTPENLTDSLAAVPAVGAHALATLDGDADRCIFATHAGEYVPGERSLALASLHAVRARGGGTVVTPISSSKCVEDAVVAAGGTIRYTAVGSPIVARVMRDIDAVFGGEENGGLIFPDHQLCRDGTMAAAWLCHVLATTGKTLEALLAEVPRYHLVKVKLACPDAAKGAVLDAMALAVERAGGGTVDRTDGVRVERPDGWILVRPSGTEPLFRVFAEAKDEATARKLSAWGVGECKKALAKVKT